MKTFVQELKTRRVYRVAIGYVVAGSAIVQVAGTVLSIFHARDWMQQLVVVCVAFGFPIALVLAWIFELKGGSIKKARKTRGSQSVVHDRQVLLLGSIGLVIALFALAGYWFWHPWEARPVAGPFGANAAEPLSIAAVPEKSIAVLPFRNLSDDKQNVDFAVGVQDEILTDLVKVADLKVISRTSVMHYGGDAPSRNLREIAKDLGVAHILEGSVQRAGDRVRVSAQLIDARTDTHVWAERYDREVADVFELESELAQQIVAQLKAKLSPEEKAAIEERPTTDLAAYDLYLRAQALAETVGLSPRPKEILSEVVSLLNQAVARAPTFFLAYCTLARTHDYVYLIGLDHTPTRLALADAAVKAALRLKPNAGEAHLARAYHLYYGFLDYDRARAELAIAQRTLPNEPLIFELTGYMDRQQGRWEESTSNFQHAIQLNPRDFYILQQLSQSYELLRRFAEMGATLDRVLTLVPGDKGTRIQRAIVDLEWRADPKPLHRLIEEIISQDASAARDVAQGWLYLALCERDGAAAARALAALSSTGCSTEGFSFPHAWCEGLAARMTRDEAAARRAFTKARVEAEKTVREQPDYAQALCILGMIDAGLGRKEDAIREGRRAIELLPVSKDAINGMLVIEYLAVIYAWIGERDLAFEQLSKVTQIPSDVSYGQLRLHPFWDPLRSDPRFEKIMASLAPK